MQIKKLYKFTRSDGGISVSLEKPPENREYVSLLRLVADEGKILTNDGKTFCPCIDVESADGWSEVAFPKETNFEVI